MWKGIQGAAAYRDCECTVREGLGIPKHEQKVSFEWDKTMYDKETVVGQRSDLWTITLLTLLCSGAEFWGVQKF